MPALLAAALPQTTSEVLAFNPHLDVLGVMVALAVGYEYGVRRLAPHYAPQGEPAVTRGQRVLFYLGLGSLMVVSTWPIHDIAEGSLFTFHMLEHLVYGLIAPPLLIAGTPWWLIRFLVKPIMPAMRILTKPLVALFLFNATLGMMHVPGVVELMVTSELAHFGIHAALLVTGILMWWPVMDPIPDLPALSPFMKMGYLFLQSLVPTIPASFLTLGSKPLYPIYEQLPRLWDLSAMSDQVIAGLIMKIGGGLIIWGFIAWVFFSWWNEEQKYGAVDHKVRTVPPS